jgi:hypothetical protein
VSECNSCLLGVLDIGETIFQVIVNEINPKLGGYHFVHDSAMYLVASSLEMYVGAELEMSSLAWIL